MVRPAILRSIASRLASPADQGSLFAVIACAESISGMLGTYIMTTIYSATVGSFRGAVFIVASGMEVVTLIIFG